MATNLWWSQVSFEKKEYFISPKDFFEIRRWGVYVLYYILDIAKVTDVIDSGFLR